MLEIKQIKELMAAMERSGTTKVQIKNKAFEVTLERAPQESNNQMRSSFVSEVESNTKFNQNHKGNAPLPHSTDMAASFISQDDKTAKEAQGSFITSPMVGTFYQAPSPDSADFVKVGDFIEKGQIVCIIEAMKVLNEIKSQVSGVLAEILIENGHPVEFGAKLFRIQ